MLTRASSSTRIPFRASNASESGFLSFLYYTRSILRHYSRDQASLSSSDRRKRIRGDARRPQDHATTRPNARPRYVDDTRWKGEARGTLQPDKSSDRFGEQGFRVNEPWETYWAQNPPTKGTGKRLSAQRDENSYTPFGVRTDSPAEKPVPSENGVPAREKTSPGRKVHRDTSHVPFERQPGLEDEDPYAGLEGTTITPNEQKAFESLFNLQKKRPDPGPPEASADRAKLSPEQSKPNASRSNGRGSLGDRLNNALIEIRKTQDKTQSARLQRDAPELPEPLKKIKQAADGSYADLSSDSKSAGIPKELETSGTTATHASAKERDSTGTSVVHKYHPKTISPVKSRAEKDIFEMRRRMREATTDVEAWNVLCTGVFDRVFALGIDGGADKRTNRRGRRERKATDESKLKNTGGTKSVLEDSQGQQIAIANQPLDREGPGTSLDLETTAQNTMEQDSQHPQPNSSSSANMELQILGQSLPWHLFNAMNIIATNFPSSPLALSIVPHLKSLGPAISTLGLSTRLYNRHLELHWQSYRDPLAIDDLLQEMKDSFYDFDSYTMFIVRGILRDLRAARNNEMGPALKAVALMDRSSTGAKKLKGWTQVIFAMQEQRALKKAQAKEARDEERRMLENRRQSGSEVFGESDDDDAGEQAFDDVAMADIPGLDEEDLWSNVEEEDTVSELESAPQDVDSYDNGSLEQAH